jgi:hypothetical protein
MTAFKGGTNVDIDFLIKHIPKQNQLRKRMQAMSMTAQELVKYVFYVHHFTASFYGGVQLIHEMRNFIAYNSSFRLR